MDNLKFIRDTMERSTSFTAVPGYGGILMGVTAIAAAYIASSQTSSGDWLATWLAEAALAFAIGMLAMWQKAKIAGESLITTPAKKFAQGFAPPILCGVALTLGLWRYGYFEMMPAAWALCYGAAIVCGGAYSVRVVPVMGWCFMALGAIGSALDPSYGNALMAVGFGGLHIGFGAVIAWRFGG